MIRPVLVCVRGNSAAGKSAVAAGIRAAYGRGVAVVGQDLLRREVLRERPVTGAANIDLIDLVARHALENAFHTVVEGILDASVYGAMLTSLVAWHRSTGGLAVSYYLDVPLAETLVRHAGKDIAGVVTPDQLRRWYLPHDTVPALGEVVLPSTMSLSTTITTVLDDTGLMDSPLRALHDTWDATSSRTGR